MKKTKQKMKSRYCSISKDKLSTLSVRVARALATSRNKNFVQIDTENIIRENGCNLLEISTKRAIKQVVFEPTVGSRRISKSTRFIANMMIKSPFKGIKRIGQDLIDF